MLTESLRGNMHYIIYIIYNSYNINLYKYNNIIIYYKSFLFIWFGPGLEIAQNFLSASAYFECLP